ncbi:hypothetical protein JTB14_014089 [Gonioctena quinquepunctata]|nr:hypothetical protein JTB14_014089 [Gonioctena quinquepunctata]
MCQWSSIFRALRALTNWEEIPAPSEKHPNEGSKHQETLDAKISVTSNLLPMGDSQSQSSMESMEVHQDVTDNRSLFPTESSQERGGHDEIHGRFSKKES